MDLPFFHALKPAPVKPAGGFLGLNSAAFRNVDGTNQLGQNERIRAFCFKAYAYEAVFASQKL
ncbi:hypothetical protein VN24_25435 [Paenibacillus beijingensis]|uniref:Uncharacterized protein n=1 Tax=Paenibacillus beijingensis TaxID=1126833 RepID=A0A0D5NPV7_9BACL|nr:hypothetical protein VN24_25435 [Paenibacillus beijingensis]